MPEKIESILKKKADYRLRGSLWLECDGDKFFGPGRVELLKGIEETGSISKAAKKMGMSYKKAWHMIDSLNSQTAVPVVILQTGGRRGGGAALTAEAKALIRYHQDLRRRFDQFLEKESVKIRP